MLKPTDEFFKFPIRVYDPNYNHEKAEEELESKGVRPPRKYVIGYARVRPTDIVSWEDTFSKYTDIEAVIEKGSMLTSVITKDNEYFCSWKRERFEEEYNNFIDSYHEGIAREVEEEMEQERQELSADNITPEIAQKLEKILKDYKKQQKNAKQAKQTEVQPE